MARVVAPSLTNAVAFFVIYVAFLFLMAWIATWLWNEYVVPLVTFARPAPSILHMLGLLLFVSILLHF